MYLKLRLEKPVKHHERIQNVTCYCLVYIYLRKYSKVEKHKVAYWENVNNSWDFKTTFPIQLLKLPYENH